MNIDIDHLKQWIGKTESYRDIVGATPIRALSATLDREDIDPKKGDAARKVFADAQALLAKIVVDKSLTARATYGYFPAGSDGDDILQVVAQVNVSVAAVFEGFQLGRHEVRR